MTVKTLIALLSDYPQDTEVIISDNNYGDSSVDLVDEDEGKVVLYTES